MASDREVMSRSARRIKPLLTQNASGTSSDDGVGLEDANPRRSAREWEIIKDMENYLEQCGRILVGIEELEDSLLSQQDQICIVTLAELAQDEGGYHRFVVDEKLWCKEVADAERFSDRQGMGEMKKK